MTRQRRQSDRIVAYNPSLLSGEELIAQFTAHREVLGRLVDSFGRAGHSGTSGHHLIVGARGSGKTMLLRRLGFAIEQSPGLADTWFPLFFPEEQYNLTQLSDLWTNALRALIRTLERAGDVDEAARVESQLVALPTGEKARQQQSFDALRRFASRRRKRLVLLLDNLDLILSRLKKEHWKLRKAMGVEDWLTVVGSSSSAIEATFRYEEAFYDFFEVHVLRALSHQEARELIDVLSLRRGSAQKVRRRLEDDPGRLRALHTLVGGNPRVLVLLQGLLATQPENTIEDDLERLLDEHTPVFRARFEQLSAQHQHIASTLARAWNPQTAAQVAAATRMGLNAVSSQLARLASTGVIERVRIPPSKRHAFQIAERLLNLWFLMRAGGKARESLLGLVRFVRLFYGPERRLTATGRLCAAHRAHVKARELLDTGQWAPALVEARAFLDAGPEHAEKGWSDIIDFFRDLVAAGHGLDGAELIGSCRSRPLFRPLEEALRAAARRVGGQDAPRQLGAGSEESQPEAAQRVGGQDDPRQDDGSLARLAPELRAPAIEMCAWLRAKAQPT